MTFILSYLNYLSNHHPPPGLYSAQVDSFKTWGQDSAVHATINVGVCCMFGISVVFVKGESQLHYNSAHALSASSHFNILYS